MSWEPIFKELPFYPTPEQVIQVVGKIPHSFFLDSADLSSYSSFSYVGLSAHDIYSGNDNPWPSLEKFAETFKNTSSLNTPFTGGVVGYLSYENYHSLETLNPPSFSLKTDLKKEEAPIPKYWFGKYDSVLVLEPQKKKAYLTGLDSSRIKKEQIKWIELLENTPSSIDPTSPFKSQLSPPIPFKVYEKKIDRIKKYLENGDIYQVNLTERFEAETSISSPFLYHRLRQISPAPYAAFINAGPFQILSASPESFLNLYKNTLETRPIKGTIRRDEDPKKDAQLREKLIHSAKDQAELLMIVDLERNDLGRICVPGSVKVEPLFALESFSQVHHLVATVKGKLKEGVTPVRALQSLFPGGSVTGAPKIRALEIIRELETSPRSVYTGALGFMGYNGNAQFNIPIRTLTKVEDKVYFHAGGGITIGSEPRAEYEEMLLKAEGIIKTLQLV